MMYFITFIFLIFLAFYSNFLGKIVEKIKLPSLIGMMIAGALIGPYGFNKIPNLALTLAPILKDVALIIVLFIGGLGIGADQIKKIGRPAVLLSIIPATLEGFAIAYLSTIFLNFSFVQGAILGFIIAAVSPAVLIPSMVSLIDKNVGQKKSIPQLLLVGASADDSIAITLFTSFLAIYFQKLDGGTFDFKTQLLTIPVSIVFSLLIGWGVGFVGKLSFLKIKNLKLKILTVFIICLSLRYIENKFHFSLYNSLLTIMSLGFFIRYYGKDSYKDIQNGMNNIWKYGKIYLFTFVGMAINPSLVGGYFFIGLTILTYSLSIRSVGVLIALIGTNLTYKERLFCVIAYLPKATVQSAKAGIPLQMGVAGGEVMQAIAILSVLITAPLGAIGINSSYKKLLKNS
ncbi:cation:proton antiporter [Candidatus Cetobacterium colombiensis]|uniref:Cation:proton antiporter n=1 Tax=Candidatus Cetobacterium colombiensis TaxID=3073100 RepID=A0ABU4W980_9FUSO|nr:cation:proton antiporter [Candidatus Cetobacterium colombiensis]MDX8334975.1 cation:proton antiporter [Candidatus Cetobacterium colombiensis]